MGLKKCRSWLLATLCAGILISGCDEKRAAARLTVYADGVPLQNGDHFDESVNLTATVDVPGRPDATWTARLNSQDVSLRTPHLVGPGRYSLTLEVWSPEYPIEMKRFAFSVGEPSPIVPFECVAQARIDSDDEWHVVTVLVEGCADAIPTHWSIDIMTGGRPRGSYTLASYRLEGGRPRLDDPTDAVFENGQWRLRFVIPRDEAPGAIEEISLTGFRANSQGRVVRPISCRVSF